MSPEQVLYRFFDKSDQLLYVGITGNPEDRFSQHRHDKPWWRKVSRIQLERFDTCAEVAEAEILAIQSEHPRYNRAHATNSIEYIRSGRDPISAQGESAPGRAVSITGDDANRMGTHLVDRDCADGAFQYVHSPCRICGASRLAQPIDITGQRTNGITYCFRCTSSWADEDDWLSSLLASP